VRAIRVGGCFHIATDVADYFALMTELCGKQPNLHLLTGAGPAHELEYLTNFERKAREQGTPVNRAVYKRH
jgi:tRNA (guanine-N7-)-methyltransferase